MCGSPSSMIFPFIVRYFDLEGFSIIVEIISLGFILAGLFRITRVLGGSAFAGLVAMLLYTAETNNWILGKPASYVNFFHHGLPYAYPLIIWSMVFFFQQRYTIAFLLAGISWSFHPCAPYFFLPPTGCTGFSTGKHSSRVPSCSAFLPLLFLPFHTGKGAE